LEASVLVAMAEGETSAAVAMAQGPSKVTVRPQPSQEAEAPCRAAGRPLAEDPWASCRPEAASLVWACPPRVRAWSEERPPGVLRPPPPWVEDLELRPPLSELALARVQVSSEPYPLQGVLPRQGRA